MEPDEVRPRADFPAAAEQVIDFLQERMGLGMWAIARHERGRWVALRVSDRCYRFAEGEVLQWVDTIDARMVKDQGPNIVPDVEAVPAYASARIRKRFQVGSYVGIPIRDSKGELFGTLSAMDPQVQPPQIKNELQLVTMLGQMLESILAADMRGMSDALRMERLKVESLSDPATALGNRRYWMHLLTAEESRCKRLEHDASVLVLDVEGLNGNLQNGELLARASSSLRRSCRTHDVMARLGGSELGLLAVHCGAEGVPAVTARLRTALMEDGIKAAMGWASRGPGRGLEMAWQEADQSIRKERQLR